MDQDLREAALEYHRLPTPGKISVVPTTAMATQRDLALAYSPGVAEPCLVIAKDELQADVLTARSNLVAVVTNGTAVLGLGNIGPLASKPVLDWNNVNIDEALTPFKQQFSKPEPAAWMRVHEYALATGDGK